MNKTDVDDDSFKNRSKKGKKSRVTSINRMKGPKSPKTKPKDGDYHLIAKQMRGRKKSTDQWYSKIEDAR